MTFDLLIRIHRFKILIFNKCWNIFFSSFLTLGLCRNQRCSGEFLSCSRNYNCNNSTGIQNKDASKTTSEANSLSECLIGCQSLECAPKTCCSTNDLNAIVVDNSKCKKRKHHKSKAEKKSTSMLSLNVASLSKLRIISASTQDMKKSVSESHVGEYCSENSSSESQNTSTILSNPNTIDIMHASIDELREKELDDGENDECQLAQNQPQKSTEEESSLLNQNKTNSELQSDIDFTQKLKKEIIEQNTKTS